MEIITLSGYTELEKLQIAKRYLLKKQRKNNGVRDSQAQISDQAIRAIINDYTREAGVRNLEREIGTVFRKIARKIAENARYKARVKPESLVEYLGRPRFFNEVRKRVASVGVATGMAWTPVGGDILFIETQAMPGTGKLVLTGQLDVYKRQPRDGAPPAPRRCPRRGARSGRPRPKPPSPGIRCRQSGRRPMGS